eukprot:TRINITY_DN45274_c0_g1_i1.p1 TRINITY_DN45274_c0_g1~~TRINITY_DN45274_c0_g1_i1.p1  ORF type:complete len:140 (+),score=46.29 TRINITY_DN45274_c0_g1_i1:191-610(+)
MCIRDRGCAHGDLTSIYNALAHTERSAGIKVDLLICCGDFQAVRNHQDLQCVAVPDKYRSMHNFYKYYSGELEAPVLTLFVGGNHEASNHLHELSHGGWVAKNIWYLSLIHISEPTRLLSISYAVFCLKKKQHNHSNYH